MTTRRLFRGASVFAAILCLAGAWPVRGQSLADVAKKEEARRRSTAEPAKVYTNKDLSRKPETVSSTEGATKAADAAKDDAKDKDAKDAKDGVKSKDASKDKDSAKEPVKDKTYWSGRLKALEDKLMRDSNYLDAMQTRINALNTDFVNRDDPVQKGIVERDRLKAIAEQGRLKRDVLDDKKAIAEFEEEARRAGIPPAWLR